MLRIPSRLPLLGLTAVAVALSACSESAVEPLPRIDATVDAMARSSDLASTSGDYVLSVSGRSLAAVSAAIADAGGTVVRSHAGSGIVIATGLSAEGAESVAGVPGVQTMAADVVFAQPTDPSPATVEFTPGDHDPSQASFYQGGLQWDMETIQADDAWAAGATAAGVTVAILDTGIDPTHPDMAGLVDASRSISFVFNEFWAYPNDWIDDHYHGTHVAGTVATNGIGTAGVAPHATLMAVKVCGAFFGCPLSAIVSGILYAADNGADVVNMSLTGFIGKRLPGGGEINALMNVVMNYASRQDVVVVSAAGNNGFDLQHLGRDFGAGSFIASPCQTGNGMCISATNYLDEPTAYTNYGTNAISVAAPGGDTGVPYLVLSPCSTTGILGPNGLNLCGPDTYLWLGGTSMAAPHVAGAAALVIGQGATAGQAKSILQRTADDLGPPDADPFYGKGRVNVLNAWSN